MVARYLIGDDLPPAHYHGASNLERSCTVKKILFTLTLYVVLVPTFGILSFAGGNPLPLCDPSTGICTKP